MRDIVSSIGYLTLPAKLYFNNDGQYSRNYFVDFDGRIDHKDKIKHYTERLDLCFVSSKKLVEGGDKAIVKNSILKTWGYFFLNFKMFFSLKKMSKANTLQVVKALAKHSRYYSLGVELTKAIKMENIFSLNLQTSLGFSEALKERSGVRIISVQHGFITPLENSLSTQWRDYYSDYYVCWSEIYAKFLNTRVSKTCKVIVDGGVFGARCDVSKPKETRTVGRKLLFVSSFSDYAPAHMIENEVNLINRLALMTKKTSYELIVRFHPSLKKIPGEIKLEDITIDTSDYLNDSIYLCDYIGTISSTSIIGALSFNKNILIFSSKNKNVLNVLFPTIDVSNNSMPIEDVISKASNNYCDLELIYGRKSGEIDKIIL